MGWLTGCCCCLFAPCVIGCVGRLKKEGILKSPLKKQAFNLPFSIFSGYALIWLLYGLLPKSWSFLGNIECLLRCHGKSFF